MKDIYRNPISYYILIPAVVALWPLLVWAIYLPAAHKEIEKKITQYNDANDIMFQILELDPDLRQSADSNDVDTEFTYDSVVAMVAGLCNIPESKYKLSSGMRITSRGQESQSATVNLKQIEIVKFAEFLSKIQRANLQCNRVKLTKKPGLPDMWDVDIEFKYYY